MVLYDDFADSLAEEVITDMANNFFGARKELENKINLFYSYITALKKQESIVNLRASFLNYLLLTPDNTSIFFKSMQINPEAFICEKKVDDNALPFEFPSALTIKGEFIKLVNWAYNELYLACDLYINGKKADDLSSDTSDDLHAYYKLINKMCELINESIKQHNNEVSPAHVLRRFKRFDISNAHKEYITGGSTFEGDDCNINTTLAFKTIDIESLDIKKYPKIMPLKKINSKIKVCCKNIYSYNQTQIKNMIAELKNKCNGISASRYS